MAQHKTLYIKWRPDTFDGVIEQEHITSILKNQVMTKKLSHSYLFCGTRGTGKTTFARILSKAVNCDNPTGGNPCNKCPSCAAIDMGNAVDIVEIDAASNNGVDNIRIIREEVFYLPAELKRKVYIIDEVHMLSLGAFNALLKTLEEPPQHVIFILATTELHKIPATILSRCQRHDFKPLTTKSIKEYLQTVAKVEGIILDENSFDLIAKLSGGAMRDALSMLEMCRGIETGGEVKSFTYTEVAELIGAGDREKLIDILECAANNDARTALELFWEIKKNSSGTQNFIPDLYELMRDIEIAKLFPNSSAAYEYIDAPKPEADRIIELSKKIGAEKLSYYNKTTLQSLINLSKPMTNKQIIIEMLIISLCGDIKIADDDKSEEFTVRNPAEMIQTPAKKPEPDGNPAQPENKYKGVRNIGDLKEYIASENKIISNFFDSCLCTYNEAEKIFKITCDNDLHKLTLSMDNNIATIRKAVAKLLKSDYSIAIDIRKKEKENDAGGDISDLE